MKKITSYQRAYEATDELYERTNVGDSLSFNAIKVTRTESGFEVNAGYDYPRGRYYPTELASLIFFPERRRVNDAIEIIENRLTALQGEDDER